MLGRVYELMRQDDVIRTMLLSDIRFSDYSAMFSSLLALCRLDSKHCNRFCRVIPVRRHWGSLDSH